MSSSEDCPPPQVSLSTFDDTASAIASAQSIEPVVSFIVTAPFAFVVLMSQCALTWVNMSASLAAANARQDDNEHPQVISGNEATFVSHAATNLEAAWLAAPIVTGIEETLNDQSFQPRPRKTQEHDILALWKRSNEFEAIHAQVNMRESESRSQAA